MVVVIWAEMNVHLVLFAVLRPKYKVEKEWRLHLEEAFTFSGRVHAILLDEFVALQFWVCPLFSINVFFMVYIMVQSKIGLSETFSVSTSCYYIAKL